METGIELISKERQKQIDKHSFTGEHHANHPEWYADGQLINAAIMLAACDENDTWSYLLYRDSAPLNWDKGWWQNMCDKPKIERLAISGALLAAEIDRRNAITQNGSFTEAS